MTDVHGTREPAALAEAAPVLPDADRMRRMLLNIEQHIRSLLTPAQAEAMNIGAGTDLDFAVFRVLSRLEDLEEAAPVRPTWQPIETSPEGEYVLVNLPHYGAVRAIRTGSDWWGHIYGDGEILNGPTLWIRLPPLPAPPSGGTAGQEST